MEAELRARVHLAGPLPEGTWELVFGPTFHEPVGVRISGARAEIWTPSTVSELDVPALAPMTARMMAMPLVAPSSRHGRDGMVLLVRTAAGSVGLFTYDGPDRWLDVAAEVVEAILGRDGLDDDVRAALGVIAEYLH